MLRLLPLARILWLTNAKIGPVGVNLIQLMKDSLLGVHLLFPKLVLRVLSGYSNSEKQMKARSRRLSAFIVSRCLDTPIRHQARVLEITSHDHSQTNHKKRLDN